MMTNYLLNRNVHGGKRRWFRFFALAVAALFLFALAEWQPSILRAPLAVLAAPLWRTGNALGEYTARITEYLRFKQVLVKEVEGLRLEATGRDALLAEYALLLEENRELKRFLGRSASEKRILAAALVFPPRSPYDVLVLDAGTAHGVSVGDDVLFGETVLGRVLAVTRATATAQLFSTAGVKTPVVIWRKDAAVPAEAVGEGGGTFRITIPKEVGVAVGDAVVMPALNPKQFAAVVAVETSATDSFATAYLRSPVNISSLRLLEIRPR